MKSSTGTIVKNIPRNSQATSRSGANEKSFFWCSSFSVAKYDATPQPTMMASRNNGGRSTNTAPKTIARKMTLRRPVIRHAQRVRFNCFAHERDA
jgi:hypothetical protein